MITFTEVADIDGDCYQLFTSLQDANVAQTDTYRGVTLQNQELVLPANINLLPQNYAQIQTDTAAPTLSLKTTFALSASASPKGSTRVVNVSAHEPKVATTKS